MSSPVIIPIIAASAVKVPTALEGDGMGCHSGGEAMLAAAKSAGKSATLDQYAKEKNYTTYNNFFVLFYKFNYWLFYLIFRNVPPL